METLKTEFGVIKYNLPNIPKTLRFLNELGISANTTEASMNNMIVLADFMEKVEPYIAEIALVIDKKKISSWEDFLDCRESLEICGELLPSFLQSLNGGDDEEKKS